MRKVVCYECGKRYDFDVDDFCPNCGAFTQPARASRIGADGSVLWADGINERNHRESFVHAELHKENRKRRGTPLSKGVKRTGAAAFGSGFKSVKKAAGWEKNVSEKQKKKITVVHIIAIIILLNVFANLVGVLFAFGF